MLQLPFVGKKTPQVFSCEYCVIFKNSFFIEHLPVAASVCFRRLFRTLYDGAMMSADGSSPTFLIF